MEKKIRIFVLLGLFLSCSPRLKPGETTGLETAGPQSSDPDTQEFSGSSLDGEESEEEGANSQSNLEIKNMAPHKIGGEWNRKIKLKKIQDPENIKVEKKTRTLPGSEGEWEAAGFLDSEGEFVDLHPQQEAKYRIGGQLESPWLHALFDLQLTDKLQECEGEVEIKAIRIHVPKGKEFEMGPCKVTLKGGEITVDGKIVSIDKENSSLEIHKSKDSATLRLISKKIKLNGEIDLSGYDGESGGDSRDSKQIGVAKSPQVTQWNVTYWEEQEPHTVVEDVPVTVQKVETKTRTVEYDEWVKIPIKYTNTLFWSLPAQLLGADKFELRLQKKSREEPYQEIVNVTEMQKVTKTEMRNVRKNNLEGLKIEAQKLLERGDLDGVQVSKPQSGDNGEDGGPGGSVVVVSTEPLNAERVKVSGGKGGAGGRGSLALAQTEPKILQIIDISKINEAPGGIVAVYKGKPGPGRTQGGSGRSGSQGKKGELTWIQTDSLTLKSLTGFE